MEWVWARKMLSTDIARVVSRKMKKKAMDTLEISNRLITKVQIMPLQIFCRTR